MIASYPFTTELSGMQKRGEYWVAKCPAHDDKRASLSIGIAKDGKLLLKCHAGCDAKAICEALGITLQDLFPKAGKREEVAVYPYHDEKGKVLYEVVRYHPKDFRQRQSKDNWSMKGVRRVLYRLPELLAAKNRYVFVVEGEKDADALAGIGCIATTCVSGAGKWRDSYSQCLSGRKVIILPDNDAAGRQHAHHIASCIYQQVESVSIIELPVPLKGDVSDWLAKGNGKPQLQKLVEDARPWLDGLSVERVLEFAKRHEVGVGFVAELVGLMK